jgi:uncharacterized protein
MSTTSASLSPVSLEQRISVIDVVRGVAILGILMMNIPYFSDSAVLADNPFIMGETGKNFYTWLVVYGAFEGTMRGLFSLLFGAGAMLLITRLEKKNDPDVTPADIYYRRLLWLLGFGLFNAYVLAWPGDILFTYAIGGLFLYPFRKMKPWGLVVIGMLIIISLVGRTSYQWYGYHQERVKGEKALQLKSQGIQLNDEQKAQRDTWLMTRPPDATLKAQAEVKETRRSLQKGYVQAVLANAPVTQRFQTTDFIGGWLLDALGFFFLGMALYKWDIITGRRSNRFYLIMMFICLLVGFGISYHSMSRFIQLKMDKYYFWEKIGLALYQFRRLGQALGYMCLIILLYKNNVFSFLWRWLSKVGQMAFSNYLMQQMICLLIFYVFGYYGKLERHETYYVVFAIWIFQIIFSNVWLRYFTYGPFEWLWRRLTYGKQ